MAFLALSPSSVGLEDDTNEIIEEAHKASAAPKSKKPYVRHAKPPTAGRMRWRWFRHEIGLKTKALGGGKKAKEGGDWVAIENMEGKRRGGA